jgi:hypothetical protein
MGKIKKPGSVIPDLTGPTATIDEKNSTWTAVYAAMQASPEWALATDVHQPAADLNKAVTDLYVNHTALAGLVAQVETKRTNEGVLLQLFEDQLAVTQSAMRKYCAGSKVVCQALGWTPRGRKVRPGAIVPIDLKGVRSKLVGTATLVWTCDGYRHEYQVQYCTDIASVATYSAPRTVSRRRFQIAGQTPGAILHMRVLTLDSKLPAGQTDWSPWAAVTVSA